MSQAYRVVAARIRQDLADIGAVVARVERAAAAAERGGQDRDLVLDSVALNLHDFYAGLERVFEYVASSVDKSVPTGPEWHRGLLRQMALEVPDLRPPVVTQEAVVALDEYLRFRHVVRNVYAVNLNPERLAYLAGRVREVFERAAADVEAFAAFLERMGSGD